MKLEELFKTKEVFQLTIPGNTPSKKSGQMIICPKNKENCPGKPFLLPNPRYTKWFKSYAKEIKVQYKGEYPVWVEMFFWRKRGRSAACSKKAMLSRHRRMLHSRPHCMRKPAPLRPVPPPAKSSASTTRIRAPLCRSAMDQAAERP